MSEDKVLFVQRPRGMKEAIIALDIHMEQRFAHLETRFAQLETRLAQLAEVVKRLDSALPAKQGEKLDPGTTVVMYGVP
jgi:uncharacterized protein YhaN